MRAGLLTTLTSFLLLSALAACTGPRFKSTHDARQEGLGSYFRELLADDFGAIDGDDAFSAFKSCVGQNDVQRLKVMRDDFERELNNELKRWKEQESTRRRHLESLLKAAPRESSSIFRGMLD